MNRCGYSNDLDQWSLIRWRGAVASAIRGERGQAFLREMLDAFDALPDKKLVNGDLQNVTGVCAIGSVGLARGIEMNRIDDTDSTLVAHVFGIAHALAAEIEFINDDTGYEESDEKRFLRVRAWVVEHLKGKGDGTVQP